MNRHAATAYGLCCALWGRLSIDDPNRAWIPVAVAVAVVLADLWWPRQQKPRS